MAESGIARKWSYDRDFKLKVVECAERENNRGATKRFGVDEKRVREWRKLKAEIAERESRRKSNYMEEERRPFLRLTRRSS